jgi:DNA-binding NarL/FixJ family response regulator
MPTVLVVEDDPNVSGLYTFVLKKRGFVVHQARDAEEGMKLLDMVKPNVIILDLLMPGDNGIDFLKKAQLEKNYPSTKVFVASNVDSDEFAKQLEPFHVEGYVVKAQYTPHRVADMVERSLAVEAGRLRLPLLARLRGWFK